MDSQLILTGDMKLALALVVFAMIMLMFERIRADVVAIVVLVLLGLSGLVAPEEIFNGFSSNAVLSIMATMIMSAGLDRTGALNRLAEWIMRRGGGNDAKLLVLTSSLAGLQSSVMQNPAVMALYMPVAARISAHSGLTLKRLLLPLATAIVCGGSITMVGSSPLILLNDLLMAANNNLPSGAASIEPLQMFSTLPVGLALLGLSLLYFHLRLRRMERQNRFAGQDITPVRPQSYFSKVYGIEGDLFELTVTADSPMVGMTFGEAETLPGAPRLLALKSDDAARLAPGADTRIWTGNILGAMGTSSQVTDFAANNMLRLSSRLRALGDLFNPSRAGIAETVIPPTSSYIGKTAAQLGLRRQHGLSLLAINRNRKILTDNPREEPIRAGDMLVMHGVWTDLAETAKNKDFVVLTEHPKAIQRPHKLKIALTIFAVSMLLALSSRLPVSIALMTGVAGMLVAGVIHIDEAYNAISWRTIFLMACLIPLGWAMDSSGAAAWVAGHSIEQLPAATPQWLIQFLLGVFTSLFSVAVGHVSATIIVVPIAINMALASGADPVVYALITGMAASNNFMTSSNPVVSMAIVPAKYTAQQLWTIGGPLSLLYIAVSQLAVNLLF